MENRFVILNVRIRDDLSIGTYFILLILKALMVDFKLMKFEFRELNMNMLVIAFYVPTSITQAALESIWSHFKSFSLPNSSLRKLRTKGLQDVECEPNFAFFMAGKFYYFKQYIFFEAVDRSTAKISCSTWN